MTRQQLRAWLGLIGFAQSGVAATDAAAADLVSAPTPQIRGLDVSHTDAWM